MTLIEVMVAMVIIAIALVVGGMAFGAVAGAETRQAAGDLSTAVRYTYNLAAINNKTYALFLDLDNGSYTAGPIEASGECDRLLLNLDGGESSPIVQTYGESKGDDDDDDDDDEGASPFASVLSAKGGSGDAPPAWTQQESTPAGKLRTLLNDAGNQAGLTPSKGTAQQTAQKRIKTLRVNQLGKAKKLPRGVKFSGVVLRAGGTPVTSGTVPILFYPHGYTQRALIYLQGGEGEDAEVFTVEIMTLQGTGQVHDEELSPDDFREVVN